MEPSEGLLTGAVLHEALHSTGIYDAMSPYKDSSAHYAPLLASIRSVNRFRNAHIESVLDVGCGVGFGVSALWNLKYVASGVDASPSAIEMANHRLVNPNDRSYPHCILGRCFWAASANHIPFPTRAADAILSAGLMEHIDAKDTQQVMAEMARVARKYLFLQIASQTFMPAMTQLRVPKKGNRTGSELLSKDFRGRAPHPIERNLKPQAYWIYAFEKHGFVLERNIPLPGWGCCAFVLRRNASSTRLTPRLLMLRAYPGLLVG